MDWYEARELFERTLLPAVAGAYGTTPESMRLFPDSEGCQNLVYAYDDDGATPKVLRISFRADRSVAQIASELDFVTYLAAHGAGVAAVVPSVQGARLEQFEAEGVRFVAVAFLRGKGMRVPDNGYRYRDGVPISEYFHTWGAMLGRLHRLSKSYAPGPTVARRPDLLEILDFEPVEARVPAALPRVREGLAVLLAELRALPRDCEGWGLVHADFNDGNFTVDYDTGEMTVFDFDDCCYGWFAYELAAAWEGGVGRTMFQGLEEREAFMESYFAAVLVGYRQENDLPDAWLDRLPLFLRVIQMQELVYFLRYYDEPDEEIQAGLAYKIRCVEEGLPYLGLFDPIYDPARPFQL